MIDYDLSLCGRGLKGPERHPKGILDLRADDNGWPGHQREYKRANDDGREHRRPRVQIVEHTEPFRG